MKILSYNPLIKKETVESTEWTNSQGKKPRRKVLLVLVPAGKIIGLEDVQPTDGLEPPGTSGITKKTVNTVC